MLATVRRTGRWATVGLIALALAITALLPALARPDPVLGLACMTNCTSLTVALTGGASGTWQTTNSSYVPNNVINCTLTLGVMSGTCFHKYQNTYPPQYITIYWLETPAPYSTGCNSTTSSCSAHPQHGSLTFYADTSVTNWSFQRDMNDYDWVGVGASVDGNGTGSVTTDTGLSCTTATSPCSSVVLNPFIVDYTEHADPGSYFIGWSDSHCGTMTTCPEDTSQRAGVTVTATFNLVGGATPPPTMTPTGTPKPSTTPNPGGTPGTTPSASSTPTHTPGPGQSSSGPTPGPNSTSAVNPGTGASGPPNGPGASGPDATSTDASTSDVPGASTGEVAANGGGAGGGAASPGPGDAAPAAATSGDSGVIVAVIIGSAIVVAGLLIGIALLLANRRRPTT